MCKRLRCKRALQPDQHSLAQCPREVRTDHWAHRQGANASHPEASSTRKPTPHAPHPLAPHLAQSTDLGSTNTDKRERQSTTLPSTSVAPNKEVVSVAVIKQVQALCWTCLSNRQRRWPKLVPCHDQSFALG